MWVTIHILNTQLYTLEIRKSRRQSQGFSITGCVGVLCKIRDKTYIYWGSCRIRIFVFLTLLQIFVPRLEILFCINHYFLVCIFHYSSSSRVNSGLETQGCYFYSNNLRSDSTKKRTAATTTAEGKCVFVCAFIGHSRWPFSGIITSFPCAPVRSCAFLCVPGRSCVFPCVLYASELASVGHYSSSLWPRIGLCCRFANPLCSQFYSLELTLVRRQIAKNGHLNALLFIL